jgi:bisphosphoglycerate-dependent phosphoglycerate mutase
MRSGFGTDDLQRLTAVQFWDERYAKVDDDKPTHEWFRTFDELEPFFQKHLFKDIQGERKDARILHLGSGDSVGSPSIKSGSAVGCT